MSDSMFSSIAENYERRMAEAKAAGWLQQRGLRRYDTIPAEALPSLLIEFSNAMNEGLKKLCNYYQKTACDALAIKLPEPFIVTLEPPGTKKAPALRAGAMREVRDATGCDVPEQRRYRSVGRSS